MASVDEVNGSIIGQQTREFGTVAKGFPSFTNGDVLFAKITPCMENGKAALASNLVNGIGAGSTEFFVLRPKQEILSEYVFHFVRQPSFRESCKANFTGSAGQQRVPRSYLERAALPLPPLEEQHRIVSLLDRAADIRSRADAARAKARAIIPALFLDMFGDPATNPKGWEKQTINSVAAYTRYGPRFPDRPYSDTGAHILRTTDMGFDGTLRWRDAPILPVTQDEVSKYALPRNTILITRTGATIGKIALFKGAERACIAGAYLIELGLSENVVGEYALHFLMSGYGQSHLVRGSRAVAQPNINAPTIRAIPILLPPLALQTAFAEQTQRLEAMAHALDNAAAKAEAMAAALSAEMFM
jgi:type I restriction enzyme S subunit